MRKIASAILGCVLLFNLFGYRFVSDYLQKKSDAQLEARLDKNHYNESELIELKIPVNMPYQTTWSDFERYDGEVELDGILYKYVKRKLVNDTLVLLCIPNHKKMDLQNARDDFYKNTNDLAQNTSKKSDGSKSSISFKKLTGDYDDQCYGFKPYSIVTRQQFGLAFIADALVSYPHRSPEQPPDNFSA